VRTSASEELPLPLSEKCPHWTNFLSPDCGRLLWTAPNVSRACATKVGICSFICQDTAGAKNFGFFEIYVSTRTRGEGIEPVCTRRKGINFSRFYANVFYGLKGWRTAISALPKDTTSKLAGLFYTLYPFFAWWTASKKAVNTNFLSLCTLIQFKIFGRIETWAMGIRRKKSQERSNFSGAFLQNPRGLETGKWRNYFSISKKKASIPRKMPVRTDIMYIQASDYRPTIFRLLTDKIRPRKETRMM